VSLATPIPPILRFAMQMHHSEDNHLVLQSFIHDAVREVLQAIESARWLEECPRGGLVEDLSDRRVESLAKTPPKPARCDS
jgi:hypothetical protein